MAAVAAGVITAMVAGVITAGAITAAGLPAAAPAGHVPFALAEVTVVAGGMSASMAVVGCDPLAAITIAAALSSAKTVGAKSLSAAFAAETDIWQLQNR
jgi:hypothetical protein